MDGSIHLIAREGQAFDAGDGIPRTIDSLEYLRTPRSIGRMGGFNDAGQLVFSALFTDGSSGIFIATVPEPSALALLSAGALLLLRRRDPHGRAVS